jgi:hypothetical protein
VPDTFVGIAPGFPESGVAMPRLAARLVAILLAGTMLAFPVRAAPLLADSLWDVASRDVAGNDWTGSLLAFTNETVGDGTVFVEGWFDWVGNGLARGRELVRGTLLEGRQLLLTGYALVEPRGIVTARYAAELAAGGTALLNGVWGGVSVVPGTWSALRRETSVAVAVDASPQQRNGGDEVRAAAVPAPGTVLLVGIGVLGWVAGRRRA